MRTLTAPLLLAGLLALVTAGPATVVAGDGDHLVIDISYEVYGWDTLVACFSLGGTLEDGGTAEQLSVVAHEDGSSTSVHRLYGLGGTLDVQVDLDADYYGWMSIRRLGTFAVLSGTDEYEGLTGDGEALETSISAWGVGGTPSIGPSSAVYYHLDTDPPPNEPPVAGLFAWPVSPDQPLTASLGAMSSWDEDGMPVDFEWDFDGDGNWDEDTGAVSWTTHTYPAAGNYTAIVRVTDNDGATDMASVKVVVNDAQPLPPTVAVSAPANGSTVSGTAVTIAATATDTEAVTSVQFYVGGTLVATDTTSPYSVTWDSTTVVDGTYAITATAWNAAGLSASHSVTTTVNNGPLPISILSIAPSEMAAGSTVNVLVTGTGFLPGAGLGFASGTGATPVASNVVVNGSTGLTARVQVKKTGPKGVRIWEVVVTNPDGRTASLTGGFTLTR